jgi:hypothetical protein
LHHLCASHGGRSPATRTADREHDPSAGLGLKVVIIEDELFAAWLIEGLLEKIGHSVIAIHSAGEEALASGLGDADLAVIDINLGSGLDGIAAAIQLRATSSARVVFCSAYSDDATRQRIAETVPGASLVGKPLLEHELRAAIRASTRPAN